MRQRRRTRANTKATRFSKQVSVMAFVTSTFLKTNPNRSISEQRGKSAVFPVTVNMFVRAAHVSMHCTCGKSPLEIW